MTHTPSMIDRTADTLARQWLPGVFVIWLLACGWFLFQRWSAIHWIALGDTDDNLRLLQVRAWLNGQDWYDLRQYKLDPPRGADIHWSRLVDLPIATLILIGRMFTTPIGAERFAVAIAPLLPLVVAIFGITLAVGRLTSARVALLGAVLLVFSQATMAMFMPLRIDHHGWQLASVAVIIAGLSDPKAVRGGIVVGGATAVSLTIGLEMMPYLAISGAALALRWIIDPREAMRLRAYAGSLGVGVVIGYAGFASYANAAPRCDALTPVWTSVMLAAGAVLAGLSLARTQDKWVRLSVAVMGGFVLVIGFALVWPQCVGRPEAISPELDRLWFQNIREVKPLYEQALITVLPASLALFGIAGSVIAAVQKRPTQLAWITVALLATLSGLLMLWQTRAAPAALMLSIPGACALIVMFTTWLRRHVSAAGTFSVLAVVVILISGAGIQIVNRFVPISPTKPKMSKVALANRTCPTLASLSVIARLPATTIFTFVDLSPRLVTMTHHTAIAGPYHRNGDAILDVHHVFRGKAEDARAIIKQHGATLLLICPHMSESTLYSVQNPQGFYAKLVSGTVPEWLEPVTLPERSPYKLWRVL